MMHDRRPTHHLNERPERLTREAAFGTALTVTAIVMLIVKFMTGIVWTGALGIAVLVFIVTFALVIRSTRGTQR